MATKQELLQEYGITVDKAIKYCSMEQIESLSAKEVNNLIFDKRREEYEQRRLAYKKAHPYYRYELSCFDEEDMVILTNKYNIDNLKKYNVINVTAYNHTLKCASVLFAASLLIYFIRYAPWLTRSRFDGKAG